MVEWERAVVGDKKLDLGSARSRQARMSVALGQTWVHVALISISVGFLFIGAWLIWLQAGVGCFIVSLAPLTIMPLVWYEWQLKNLPVSKKPKTIDDHLEAGLLGRLSRDDSPHKIASIVASLPGGIFFAARFGIGPNFLSQLSSADPAVSAQVWQAASEIQQQLGLSKISSAVVVASLIKILPQRDQLLANLQLTFDDIIAGVRWDDHQDAIIAKHQSQNKHGGIGRDLNFGFTPLLERFALNVTSRVIGGTLIRDLEGHQQLIDQLVDQLANSGRKNAVLVGPSGVGKTTLVYAFAERIMNGEKIPPELKYRQVMAFDPATLISNSKDRGGLEGLVNQLITEAHMAKNVIIFFDNAELFFSDETGAVDLRNVLLPVLQSGTVRMILSMDEQQWLKLGLATPALTQQLNRLSVPPMSQDDTMLVCEDQLIMYEYQHKITYMYQALKSAYRLGGRYVSDLAMPGQALRVLEGASQYASNNILVTAESVEKFVEQTFGIKVTNVNNDGERQKLLNLEQLIHKRMINQTRAVGVVSNALRRARSGVRNQNRPIGSFLFLGPTGVGKTELAKALAEVYFEGEDNIVRLDLNEFGQAKDVSRLIADASTDSRSLTAQISKQPFSVVLLDEIEKAHPNVLNTLLQLIDEGILRDVNNRDVSFRDAMIVATSNAGADKIRQYISEGKKLEEFEEQFTNELIDAGIFKPEFLNRFDEIVLFRPLTPDELMQVVDLMIASVNKTLALQQISVDVAPDAKERLVQVGNDPRLGARPLRRVVQRTVENIVAQRVLQGQTAPGETLHIGLSDIEAALQS